MKKQLIQKKLTLTLETLKVLNKVQLERVAGGDSTDCSLCGECTLQETCYLPP